MKRTIIIFAIIGISISAATTVMAQNKGRGRSRQNVHVGGLSGNDSISRSQVRTSRVSPRDTNHNGNGLINWGDGAPTNQAKAVEGRGLSDVTDGTSNTLMGSRSRSNILSGTPTANGTFSRRANAVTFEGNDEPLWAKGGQSTYRSGNAVRTAQNVGPQINGNVRPKGFANTTFDDQAARSSQLVQGNQIGTNVRPRRTGLFGDANGDSDVDATDYALKGSTSKNNVPAGRRSGISGGDFNTDGPTTIGRSSLSNAGGSRSLSAGTYGRGNRR